MRNAIEGGLLRNVRKENTLKVQVGFQTLESQLALIPVNMLPTTSGLEELSDHRVTGANSRLVYGRTIKYGDGEFAEIRILFSPHFQKMIVAVT